MRRRRRSPSPFYNTLPTQSHQTPLACSTQIPAHTRSIKHPTRIHTHCCVHNDPSTKATLHASLCFAPRWRQPRRSTLENRRRISKNNKRLPWQTGIEDADENRPSKNDGPAVRKSRTIGQRDRKRLQNRMPSNVSFVAEGKEKEHASFVAPARGDAACHNCRFFLQEKIEETKVGLTPPRPWGPHGGSLRCACRLPLFFPLPASAAAAPVPRAACLARPLRPPWGSPRPRQPPEPRR